MHQSKHTDSFPKDHAGSNADGAAGKADNANNALAMTVEPVSDKDKRIARSIQEEEAFRRLASQRKCPRILQVTSLIPLDNAHGS